MQTCSNRARALPAPGVALSWRLWGVVLGALLALGAAQSARAQSAGDPPSRAARLSDAEGQVWLYSSDSDEWVTVARNRPLTTGDRIATDNGARAEITLGTTTLRLDAATELEIARLDDTRYSVRLRGGSVAARLRNPQSLGEFEMLTDEGRFRIQAVGRYRFDRFDLTSDVTVYGGQAIYEARNTALPVTAGQHAQFWLDSAGVPQYAIVPPARDAFAGWNDDRDRAEDRIVTATTRYVSPEMTGAEDLDRYGQWEQTPEYGALWVPRSVAADWAPYTTGHWAWVRPWGWTWVDDAPWGFAPFHYGRWVYHRNVWCWAPGSYVARPVYAPALVAWIGGPRVGVSISVGAGAPVGWFPLAPREVYVPAYRASPRYVQQVNVTHVTNVTNITTIVNNRNGEADRRDFANRKYAHAVTFVPAEVMTRRQPVAPAAARFRNDPQVRALVADNAQPAPVLTAPPVTAPQVAPRPPQGRPAPRPPFEGRAPGGFAGRPDGTRPDAARSDAARPDAARPDVARPDAGRADAGRADAGRPDTGRPGGSRSDGGRGEGRPDFVRPGERPPALGGMAPRVAAPQGGMPPVATPSVVNPAATPPPVAAQAVAPQTAPPPRVVAPPVTGAPPPNPPATAGAPVGARGVVTENSTGRPAGRGGPRNEQIDAGAAPHVAPPSPVQRNAQPGEATGPRGLPGREMRAPVDGGAGEARGARPSYSGPPYGAGSREAAPGQIPQGAIPQGTLPQRTFTPRPVDAPRAAEAQRPAPANRAPEAAVGVPRPAAAAPPTAAPAVVQRAPEARPPEAQRPPGEAKMNRPEAPRGRGEERREEKAEKQK